MIIDTSSPQPTLFDVLPFSVDSTVFDKRRTLCNGHYIPLFLLGVRPKESQRMLLYART